MYLEGAPVAIKSVMQRIIARSVTEAELIALVQCTQEIFFAKKVLESLGLLVEVHTKLQCDNKGTVDLINRYSIGDNTKHIDVRILHIRDHKYLNNFTRFLTSYIVLHSTTRIYISGQ